MQRASAARLASASGCTTAGTLSASPGQLTPQKKVARTGPATIWPATATAWAPFQSMLPAVAYLVLHTIEGQIVTPIILGRRMALSPLVLILALMLFGWLWGIIGLLLAVPLLVCVKLVLARVEGMEGWARLLE